MITEADNLSNKRLVSAAMRAIAGSSAETLRASLEQVYHPQVAWRGSHPWNELSGIEALASQVWLPLLHSFPDLERRDNIVMGGEYEGRQYVGMVGHLTGTFRRAWNGIPATDQVIYWRYGEMHQVEHGKIVQSNVLLDVLDFVRQAGYWPIAPSRGQEGMWPGPISADGLMFTEQDPAQSAASLALTMAMQASLGAYDDAQGGREG